VVYTTGFSGSLFLSKILNSHKDVFCLHESEMFEAIRIRDDGIVEERFFFELEEKEKFSSHFFFMSPFLQHYYNGYKAVGSVETGRFNPQPAIKILKDFVAYKNGILKDSGVQLDFRYGFLLRSPIKVINSFSKELEKILNIILNQNMKEKIKKLEEFFGNVVGYAKEQGYISEDKLSNLIEKFKNPHHRLFLFSTACVMTFLKDVTRSILNEKENMVIFRLEEKNKKDLFEEKLKKLTSQEYKLDEKILEEKVNQKHKSDDEISVLDDWGKEKREIFFDLMINCEEEIKILGYSYIFDLMSNLDHIYYQNTTDISFLPRKISFASR
jgi:hypothetical protein